MMSIEELKAEAMEYQEVSEISKEVKDTIIKVFADVITFEDYTTLYDYVDALKDTILSIICENYRGVVYSVDIKHDGSSNIAVSLLFVYDKCERSFTISEYDFKTYIEERDED